MAEYYRPRLAIDLTEEQAKKLNAVIPWGSKTLIFQLIINDLLDLCDKHGAGKVIGAFVERHFTVKEICKLNVED